MPHRVLAEDWSEYDNRKIRNRKDSAFFSCEELWEVEYLVNKIKKYKPHHSYADIKVAIAQCCSTVPGNKPRKEFVECVMAKLQRI